jgi:hypothetical protein
VEQQLKFPAQWMQKPVSGATGNNWVEVEKGQAGQFIAEVGMETFEDEVKLSLPAGRILSATMENPVEVLELDCDDQALATCGGADAFHYQPQDHNCGTFPKPRS